MAHAGPSWEKSPPDLVERFGALLDKVPRAELLRLEGASVFAPMPGRPMAEYVAVPPSLRDDPVEVRPWIERALRYASTLPAKK